MTIRASILAAGIAAALVASPAFAQPQTLTGTWTVAGENRYSDCTMWQPSGQLVIGAPNAEGRYTGRIEISGRTVVDKSCPNPPAEPPSGEENRFASDVELTVEKDMVTIREIELDRSFQYRWTAQGLEFQLESCRAVAPCTATTFRYVRR